VKERKKVDLRIPDLRPIKLFSIPTPGSLPVN